MSECTDFRGQDGQNILRGFIFVSAPKNYVLHVLMFVESPKMHKIVKFYTRENLVP